MLTLASHAKEPAKRAGLDPARLARIDAAVQGYIDAKQIPGAVTLVATGGGVAFVPDAKHEWDGSSL